MIAGFGGVLILSVFNNIMNLLGVNPFYQIVLKGVILILAVSFSRFTCFFRPDYWINRYIKKKGYKNVGEVGRWMSRPQRGTNRLRSGTEQ